jgi:hypothetical protein
MFNIKPALVCMRGCPVLATYNCLCDGTYSVHHMINLSALPTIQQSNTGFGLHIGGVALTMMIQ